ncbi:2-deoxy-D-gluconate 3-dehydrogenase [Striga asiatica]|uniref:2-deoxy-D-gluconate 3-dehydrogenase n=1 Tax=Striga asiatica TaxID=4170 RepID=A0A5A7RKV3_STRAF|nr:2-deoxy-D-gluconate 3-dehydrogenase [Striga asiatica]
MAVVREVEDGLVAPKGIGRPIIGSGGGLGSVVSSEPYAGPVSVGVSYLSRVFAPRAAADAAVLHLPLLQWVHIYYITRTSVQKGSHRLNTRHNQQLKTWEDRSEDHLEPTPTG